MGLLAFVIGGAAALCTSRCGCGWVGGHDKLPLGDGPALPPPAGRWRTRTWAHDRGYQEEALLLERMFKGSEAGLTRSRAPLIAVLRGVEAHNVEEVGRCLLEGGISTVSIPVGAPAGLSSLRLLRESYGGEMLLGVATVTSVAQVDEAAMMGASYISCPHTDPEIIERALSHGLMVMPGVMTLTEAFLGIKHGARLLKLFPSSAISPDTMKSMRAVLPKHVPLIVSGGVTPETLGSYVRVGASGFALGSTLYSAGMSSGTLRQRAESFVRAWRQAVAPTTEGEAVGPVRWWDHDPKDWAAVSSPDGGLLR